MPKKTPYLISLICIMAFFSQIEDLTHDADFFQKQTAVYQRWLDNSGLGAYLSVYDIEVQKDMLSIYLRFPFADLDSII